MDNNFSLRVASPGPDPPAGPRRGGRWPSAGPPPGGHTCPTLSQYSGGGTYSWHEETRQPEYQARTLEGEANCSCDEGQEQVLQAAEPEGVGQDPPYHSCHGSPM